MKEIDDVRIIRLLVDAIMFENYEEIFNRIKVAINEDYNRIVLDLEKVTFMDSISLGMLVPLLLYTRRMEGEMAVASLKPNIRDLFETLRLDKIISVYADTDDAVAHLR